MGKQTNAATWTTMSETLPIPILLSMRFHALQRDIETHTTLYLESCNRESLRLLRLAIKRIRLFFFLGERLLPGFPKEKDFKTILCLFKDAGKLRDLHIHHEIIQEWRPVGDHGLNPIINQWKAQERRQRHRFLRTAIWYLKQNQEKIAFKVSDACQSTPDETLRQAIDESFQYQIAPLLYDEGCQEWHTLRGACKSARYALELVALAHTQVSFKDEFSHILQEMARALGRWHDHDQTALWLRKRCKHQVQIPDQAHSDLAQLSAFLTENSACHLKEFQRRWESFRIDPVARNFIIQLSTLD